MNYFGLKLRSGETIFAEVLDFKEKPSPHYVISYPMLLDHRDNDRNGWEVAFLPYVVYSKEKIHQLSADQVFMADKLSKKFIGYYGNAVLNSELSDIKADVADQLVGNINHDYPKLLGMIDKMRAITDHFAEKFEDLDIPDFVEMENRILDQKPTLN